MLVGQNSIISNHIDVGNEYQSNKTGKIAVVEYFNLIPPGNVRLRHGNGRRTVCTVNTLKVNYTPYPPIDKEDKERLGFTKSEVEGQFLRKAYKFDGGIVHKFFPTPIRNTVDIEVCSKRGCYVKAGLLIDRKHPELSSITFDRKQVGYALMHMLINSIDCYLFDHEIKDTK